MADSSGNMYRSPQKRCFNVSGRSCFVLHKVLKFYLSYWLWVKSLRDCFFQNIGSGYRLKRNESRRENMQNVSLSTNILVYVLLQFVRRNFLITLIRQKARWNSRFSHSFFVATCGSLHASPKRKSSGKIIFVILVMVWVYNCFFGFDWKSLMSFSYKRQINRIPLCLFVKKTLYQQSCLWYDVSW